MSVLRIGIIVFIVSLNGIVGAIVNTDLGSVKFDGDHINIDANKGEVADFVRAALPKVQEALPALEKPEKDEKESLKEIVDVPVGGFVGAVDGLPDDSRQRPTDIGKMPSEIKYFMKVREAGLGRPTGAIDDISGAALLDIFGKGKIDPLFNKPKLNLKPKVEVNAAEGESSIFGTIKMIADAYTHDIYPQPDTNIYVFRPVPLSNSVYSRPQHASTVKKPQPNPFSNGMCSQPTPNPIDFAVPKHKYNMLNTGGNMHQGEKKAFGLIKKFADATLGAIRDAYNGWKEDERKIPTTNVNFVESVPVPNTVGTRPYFISTVSKTPPKPVSNMVYTNRVPFNYRVPYTNPVPFPDSYLRPSASPYLPI